MREVVEKINAIYSKETEWRIELLGWEDTLPGTGRPQELINTDLDKADLFVGCLWQRWGSSSGKDGKTGFEEEFERALERHDRTGSPEMWLFFKEVDTQARADPGLQLQKVLEFRNREITAKRLMFREFPSLAVWRELLNDLLHRSMLRLVRTPTDAGRDVQGTGTGTGSADSSPGGSEPPKVDPKGALVRASLADTLKLAEELIRSKKLAVFERSEALKPAQAVRLLLFAVCNYHQNVQHVELGAHEINSVYLHRDSLVPTRLEELFLLRTVLLDQSLTKPGWFWIRKWRIHPALWLLWFASSDSEEPARIHAVNFASRLAIPLYLHNKGSESPIARLFSDKSASVRLAVLQHVAALGRKADLSAIEPLLQDHDKEVRAQAERTARLVRLKAAPDAETLKAIQQRDAFDEQTAEAVARNAHTLSDETLTLALTHSSGALRAVASRELLKRGRITADQARAMRADEAKAVKECGYFAEVAQGAALDTSKVRSALEDSLLSFSELALARISHR